MLVFSDVFFFLLFFILTDCINGRWGPDKQRYKEGGCDKGGCHLQTHYLCMRSGFSWGDFFWGEVYGVGKCMQKLSHRECASEKQVLNWCYSLSRSLFFSCCCHCLSALSSRSRLTLLAVADWDALSCSLTRVCSLKYYAPRGKIAHTERDRERDGERGIG